MKMDKADYQLKDLCKIRNGINPGYPESRQKLLIENPMEGINPVKRLDGKDIYRYGIQWNNKWIDYNKDMKIEGGSLRDEILFTENKILVQDIRNLKLFRRIVATFDDSKYYNLYTLHNILIKNPKVDLKYILAILNSKLMNFYFSSNFKDIHIKPRYLSVLPFYIPETNFQMILSDKADSISEYFKKLNILSTLFETLLQSKYEIDKLSTKLQKWYELDFKQFIAELKKKKVVLSLSEEAEWMSYFNEKKTEAHELKAKIDKTDNEIDLLVYKLYDLTYDEVLIVDPETKISREVYGG
jgi:hypothetical protein